MGLLDRFLKPPTQEKFARLLAAALRAAGDPRTSRYDAGNSRLEFTENGKPAGVLNVVNLFGEYRRGPSFGLPAWASNAAGHMVTGANRPVPGIGRPMPTPCKMLAAHS
jgi:hypothetical protein